MAATRRMETPPGARSMCGQRVVRVWSEWAQGVGEGEGGGRDGVQVGVRVEAGIWISGLVGLVHGCVCMALDVWL